MIVAIKPPYTYVGGKRRLLKVLDQHIPERIGNYYEPFLGAGALAIHMMQKHPDSAYYLSDWNFQIPVTWEAIHTQVEDLIELLSEHAARHNEGYFYAVRNWDRLGMLSQMSRVEIAARFIYICNNAHSGGYDVTGKGYSKNSYGIGKSYNVADKNLRELSALLNDRNVQYYRRDFAEVGKYAKAGDFIYFDPPYAIKDRDEDPNASRGNDSYVKLDDTTTVIRNVHKLMDEMNSRGVYALASNTSTRFTEDLWKGWNKVTVPIYWTGGANHSRDPEPEVLWSNNALYRALQRGTANLPGDQEPEAPRQRRSKAPSSDEQPQMALEPTQDPEPATDAATA